MFHGHCVTWAFQVVLCGQTRQEEQIQQNWPDGVCQKCFSTLPGNSQNVRSCLSLLARKIIVRARRVSSTIAKGSSHCQSMCVRTCGNAAQLHGHNVSRNPIHEHAPLRAVLVRQSLFVTRHTLAICPFSTQISSHILFSATIKGLQIFHINLESLCMWIYQKEKKTFWWENQRNVVCIQARLKQFPSRMCDLMMIVVLFLTLHLECNEKWRWGTGQQLSIKSHHKWLLLVSLGQVTCYLEQMGAKKDSNHCFNSLIFTTATNNRWVAQPFVMFQTHN